MDERRPRIDLFCEDRGHEQFVRALVQRLVAPRRIRPALQAASTRGGHGRALSEFELWQKSFLDVTTRGMPDLLILVIDANCAGWNAARQELERSIDRSSIPRYVVGCPDPHVERWYMADPSSFADVVGAAPPTDPGKCDRGIYKRLLVRAAEEAGVPLLTGPADLAPDLVEAMDLFRAGKSQPSLKHFVDDLKTALQSIS